MFLNTTFLRLNDIIDWAVDASVFGELDLEHPRQLQSIDPH